MNNFNLGSLRARKSRLATKLGFIASPITEAIGALIIVLGIFGFLQPSLHRLGYLSLGFGLLVAMSYLWVKRDLCNLPPSPSPRGFDDILEPKLLGSFPEGLTQLSPQQAWQLAAGQWQTRFLCNRLLLDEGTIAQTLSPAPADMQKVWDQAHQLMTATKGTTLNAGTLACTLMITSEPTKQLLTAMKLKPEDVLETYSWLERLDRYIKQPKPYFGGIGRDWATGYTPNLEQFGQNISNSIEVGSGGHFHTLAHHDVVDTIIYNLGQGNGGVALVGETGVGKTSLVYALAERLLEGKDKNLQHYQIVSLNASVIISSAKEGLEKLLLTLLSEAIRAGNMIVFLDEAHLFFGEGTGALNASQVLQPIMQKHQLKIIATFTPNEYQGLRVANSAITDSFTSVTINEPSPEVTMSILEDTALTF